MTDLRGELARAAVMIDLKRYKEAAALLARLAAAEPGESRVWSLLARAQLGAGRPQDALTAANQAVTLAPSDDWPHRVASTALLHLGNSGEALRAAREAVRLAPHEWRAQVCLAQAALGTRRRATIRAVALPASAAARSLAPDEADVHFVSGQTSLALRRRREAREHQQRALSIKPDHGPALNELGRISLQRRSPGRAARHFLQAIGTAPGTSVYSGNIEVAVRHAAARVIYLASALSFGLMLVAVNVHLPRAAVLAVAAGIAAVIAAIGAGQFWRLPRQVRPLLRRPHIAKALCVCYGGSLLAIVILAVVPAREVPRMAGLILLLLLTARFAAIGILRGGRPGPAAPPSPRPGGRGGQEAGGQPGGG